MKITKEQGEAIVAKLKRMRPCPMCGAAEYRFTDDVHAIVGFEQDDTKPILMSPAITVACGGCGHYAMFSAGHLLGPSAPTPSARNLN